MQIKTYYYCEITMQVNDILYCHANIFFFLEEKIIGMKPIKAPFFLCKAFSVFLNEDALIVLTA